MLAPLGGGHPESVYFMAAHLTRRRASSRQITWESERYILRYYLVKNYCIRMVKS